MRARYTTQSSKFKFFMHCKPGMALQRYERECNNGSKDHGHSDDRHLSEIVVLSVHDKGPVDSRFRGSRGQGPYPTASSMKHWLLFVPQ